MEEQSQKGTGAQTTDEEVCDLCKITYSIYSKFPPMPSAQALNVETGEFFPFDRVRKMKSGYDMVKALGYAQACTCRGRSRTPPQNLGNAQGFTYQPDTVSGDTEELAASTNNPDYAAKMLGYDRKTFGKMIHMMKEDNRLRGDDNVIWHDDGGVEFRGAIIDNMHSWTP
ncbi:hypothetical protein VSR82_04145 [Burkholderia sp. JPY481]|uniref:hypothetical protein n=1 Tax=Paraburkholderia sp. JPY465 TaxID=3042285 RepID=UPI003170CB34